MSDELPAGWILAQFMDVFDIQGGTQPPKSAFKYEATKGYIQLLQIRDFGDKPVPTYIPSKPNLKTCKKNDILIGRYGASIGRICTGFEGAYNVALAKVIIPEAFDRRYVFQLLRSPWFQRPILNIERSAQDGFNKEDLAQIAVPLAPLPEQKRIVAKLELLLERVAGCQQRMTKIPQLLKRFRQAILAAACSGRLTADWREENASEDASTLIQRIRSKRPARYQDATVRTDLDFQNIPDSWAWTNLRFLLSPDEAFCYGVVQPGADDLNGALLIRAGDLEAGSVNTSLLRRIPLAVHADYRRSQLKGGEVLVTVVGAGIGETAIAQPACAGFNIARAVAKLPVREFESRFVHLWLQTTCAVGWMKGDSREVARPTLNLEQLQTLPVPVAPLSEQKEIVRRVEGLFALADKLEARLATAQRQVDRLTPSILARAFAGRLVPQDPADEPAEKLLARLKAKAKG